MSVRISELKVIFDTSLNIREVKICNNVNNFKSLNYTCALSAKEKHRSKW